MTEISKILPENLDRNKQYVVRARSINAVGNVSDWSEGLYIDTSQDNFTEGYLKLGNNNFSILNDNGEIIFGAYSVQEPRTNLAKNPSFELNTTNWTALSNSTITRTAVKNRYGTWCAQIVPSSSNQANIGITLASAGRINVAEHEVYSVSAYVMREYDKFQHGNVAATKSNIILEIDFFDADGNKSGSVAPAKPFEIINNEWVRLEFPNIEIPNAIAKLGLTIKHDAAQTIGIATSERIFIDGVLIEKLATVEDYFDGSLLPGTTSWLGTPHDSNSYFDTSAGNSLNIQGTIIAKAGYIGTIDDGWVITGNQIKSADGEITLDSQTGKIYIGAGNYANSDTSFYTDRTGKFSLKNSLTFDGDTLSIGGGLGVNTYYKLSSDPPASPSGGDIWFVSDTNEILRWNASLATPAWESVQDAIQSGDVNNDLISTGTYISGGNIQTGNIQSTGYSGVFDGSNYSTTGMNINLDNGSITSKNFRITTTGSAYFKGDITGASGTFSGTLSSATITSSTITGGIIAIGSGNAIFKADSSGIYLGNASYGSAPFRVSMGGGLVATNATIIGTITSSNATITGGTITIGSSNDVFKVDANGIYLGNASWASAPFRVERSTGTVRIGSGTTPLYLSTSSTNGRITFAAGTHGVISADSTRLTIDGVVQGVDIVARNGNVRIRPDLGTGGISGVGLDIDAGGVNAQGHFRSASAGSAAGTIFGPQGDVNTGMYFPAADALRLCTGGGDKISMDASNVFMPTVYSATATGRDVYVNSNGLMGNNVSSIKYKTDIQDMDLLKAYDIIKKSRVVKYKYDLNKFSPTEAEDINPDYTFYGLIAEELEEIDPRFVWHDEMDDGYQKPVGIDYKALVNPLIKVVQDLISRIEELEK